MKITIVKDNQADPNGEVFKALLIATEAQDALIRINKNGSTYAQVTLTESANLDEVKQYLVNLGKLLVEQYSTKEEV